MREEIVLPGYQSTEVGLLPKEWTTTTIDEVADCFSGGTPSTSNPAFYGGEIPWITSSDLNSTRIKTVIGRITKLGLEYSSAKLVSKGTLLFALYGATAGVVAITEIDAAINQAVLAVLAKNIDTDYLFQFLRHNKEYLITTFTQGGQPNFSGGIVKSFIIPKPPLHEQRAIATALSDVDALIAGLDQLIAKKRDLKQAAMQQLLTGQRRLPGFGNLLGFKQTEIGLVPTDWQVARLDSLGAGSVPPIKAGPFGSSLTKDTYVSSGYKIYGQEQVISGDHTFGDYFISQKKYRELQSCSVKAGDILLSLVGTLGKVLVVPNDFQEGIINPRLIRLSFDKKRVDSFFAKFVFESDHFQKSLARSAQGGTMGVLNAGIFRSITIPIPCISEQIAIANSFTVMDAEISALEQRRDKTRALKQGMMQELLTGKTRLI